MISLHIRKLLHEITTIVTLKGEFIGKLELKCDGTR